MASRVGMGGGLGNVCPLTCLYSAVSVLGHCKSRGFGLLPPQDVELRRTLASPTGRVREVDESNLPDPNFELAAA